MKDFNWKDIKGSRSVILGAILIVAGLVIFVSVFKFIVMFILLVGGGYFVINGLKTKEDK
jgi:uncharacterized membrane protein